MRGLDRWKDFDGVVTFGDPRPNLDHVGREVGAEALAEESLSRADARACAELEQAHGRLRTVHRERPGWALHVGALVPAGWQGFAVEQPPGGRPPREHVGVEELRGLVAACGGQRRAAAAVRHSLSTVQRWLAGETTPHASDVAALLRAGTERRQTEHVEGDPESPISNIQEVSGSGSAAIQGEQAAE
jgi:hypothetical protein